jgi:hypothetical protein
MGLRPADGPRRPRVHRLVVLLLALLFAGDHVTRWSIDRAALGVAIGALLVTAVGGACILIALARRLVRIRRGP